MKILLKWNIFSPLVMFFKKAVLIFFFNCSEVPFFQYSCKPTRVGFLFWVTIWFSICVSVFSFLFTLHLGIVQNSEFFQKPIFIIYSEFIWSNYHGFEQLQTIALDNPFFNPFQINNVSMDQCSLLILLENISKPEVFWCFQGRKNREHGPEMG